MAAIYEIKRPSLTEEKIEKLDELPENLARNRSIDQYIKIMINRIREGYLNAQKSVDISTQNGAVMVNRDLSVIGNGWNRTPLDLPIELDYIEENIGKQEKYSAAVHAEQAAIRDAELDGSITGLTLVCPWAACSWCAKEMIDKKVSVLVRSHNAINTYRENTFEYKSDRHDWKNDVIFADYMLTMSGVRILELEHEYGDEELAIRKGFHTYQP